MRKLALLSCAWCNAKLYVSANKPPITSALSLPNRSRTDRKYIVPHVATNNLPSATKYTMTRYAPKGRELHIVPAKDIDSMLEQEGEKERHKHASATFEYGE